ncbi:unnamed protein product, partial [Adineta steineri]
MWSYIYAPPKW